VFQNGTVYRTDLGNYIIGIARYHAQKQFFSFTRYVPPLPELGEAVLLRSAAGGSQTVIVTEVSTDELSGASLFSYE
jgi:hypothetical protein